MLRYKVLLVMAMVTVVVAFGLGGLVDDRRLGGAGLQPHCRGLTRDRRYAAEVRVGVCKTSISAATHGNKTPPAVDRGCLVDGLVSVAVVVTGVLVRLGGLVDDGRLRGCGLQPRRARRPSSASDLTTRPTRSVFVLNDRSDLNLDAHLWTR